MLSTQPMSHRSIAPLLVAVWMLAAPASGSEMRRFHESLRVGDLETIILTAAAASVNLVQSPADRVELEIILTCSGDVDACRRAADQVAVVSEPRGGALDVHLVGPVNHVAMASSTAAVYRRAYTSCRGSKRLPRMFGLGRIERTPDHQLSADLWLGYPAGRAVKVSLQKGHFVAERLQTSIEIELDEGTVSIIMPTLEARSVQLQSGRKGRTRLLLPDGSEVEDQRSARWDAGTGTAEVKVSIERGDAALRLVGSH